MLEARDIHFAYPGQPPLFNGLDLEVHSHERLALVAPSGVGKSTFCKLLSGYLKPHKGSVFADGSPLPTKGICPVQLIWQHPEQAVDPHMRMKAVLAEAGPAKRRIDHRMTPSNQFVSEDGSPALIDASPVNNTLCERLGIRDEWLTRRPHELSGGELQRFCIARALAANPRYLIGDEISTMLDAITQAQIWKVLLEECEARSIGLIFVSHSPALTSRIATRVVKL